MIRWKVYYGDGSTFSNEDGEPEEAPPYNVQVVAQPSIDAGRELVHGFDWYWWRPDVGGWYGGDIHGFMDQAMHCGAVWPKQARTLTNTAYRDVFQQAAEDPVFAWLSDRSYSHGGRSWPT